MYNRFGIKQKNHSLLINSCDYSSREYGFNGDSPRKSLIDLYFLFRHLLLFIPFHKHILGHIALKKISKEQIEIQRERHTSKQPKFMAKLKLDCEEATPTQCLVSLWMCHHFISVLTETVIAFAPS